MFLELDGEGPSYVQVARAIKGAILAGRVAPGARLPTTRALAYEIGMSRITVLTAYEQLRAEGIIHSRVGSGSYVSHLPKDVIKRPSIVKTIDPPSRYIARARQLQNRTIARQHHGLRFDMQYGRPVTNLVLNNVWARELAKAAVVTPLDQTFAQGLPALREQVCRYLAHRRGILVTSEDVLIVNGFQQAINLAARVLVDEGDTVVQEDPHYYGTHQALGSHGAKLLSVPVDRDGLICAQLPEAPPKLIVVTPSHQFPSGSVLSLSRRLELLRYAEEKQCWILEDDYDSEFCYGSQPVATLRSLDTCERVIYGGTFSKVLSSALRLAYMVLPRALRDDFVTAKFLEDSTTTVIEQVALAHFMEDGGFERHLRHTAKVLRARRKLLVEGITRLVGDRVEIANSNAGMHLVAWLPGYSYERVDQLIAHAREQGLGIYPIAPHYENRPLTPGLLLGYCGLSSQELRLAMQIFADCLDAMPALETLPSK